MSDRKYPFKDRKEAKGFPAEVPFDLGKSVREGEASGGVGPGRGAKRTSPRDTAADERLRRERNKFRGKKGG